MSDTAVALQNFSSNLSRMARYYPPKQHPIEHIVKLANALKVTTDNIVNSTQGISETEFKEPWIFYVDNAERALNYLQGYSTGLFAQLQKMKAGDPAGPPEDDPKAIERSNSVVTASIEENEKLPLPRKVVKKRKLP